MRQGRAGDQCQGTLESGMVRIEDFIQVNFHNAIVVEVHGFTEGVLGDFEPTVEVASP